jgi:hypothetical protein
MNLLGHIERWLRRHSRDFSSLPLVSVASAAVSDEDTEYWGEIRYLQELLEDITYLMSVTHDARLGELSPVFSAILEEVLADVRDGTQWVIELGVSA